MSNTALEAGRTALVTGAASGIGLAACRRCRAGTRTTPEPSRKARPSGDLFRLLKDAINGDRLAAFEKTARALLQRTDSTATLQSAELRRKTLAVPNFGMHAAGEDGPRRKRTQQFIHGIRPHVTQSKSSRGDSGAVGTIVERQNAIQVDFDKISVYTLAPRLIEHRR